MENIDVQKQERANELLLPYGLMLRFASYDFKTVGPYLTTIPVPSNMKKKETPARIGVKATADRRVVFYIWAVERIAFGENGFDKFMEELSDLKKVIDTINAMEIMLPNL